MKNPLRRDVGRRFLVAALAALLPVAFAMPAEAASDSVDQSVWMTSFWPGSQSNFLYMAETFTAVKGGSVDRVSLPLSTVGFGMYTVSLYNVDQTTHKPSGLIVSAPTKSGFISCCANPDYWLSQPASVSPGVQYAIVVHQIAGTVKWFDTGATAPNSVSHEWIGGNGVSWLPTTHGDFGFKEWVAANTVVNHPPTVTVDKSVISYPEGSSMSATNSGTCADPDGDAVTLTATAGAVSACTSGRWSWSMGTPDELAQEQVTITASDGSLTTPVNFTVAVDPVAPTAQILSDPPTITVAEGSTVPFTGAGNSPDAADNAAGFNYNWTVASATNATYATGTNSSFSFVPEEPGSYLVTFTVTDDAPQSGSTSMTVIATSVPPTAKINSWPSALVITPNEILSFGGGYTDADQDDSITTTWNFGDGSQATGTAVTHFYAQPGNYTVTFHVDDGEGGASTASATLTVQTTQQSLNAIKANVLGLSLNAGQKNSLTTKLDNAAAAVARGDNNAASNELNAFLNELQADVNSGKVTTGQAATLRTAVNLVRGSLGTFNRLVEWWPLEA